MTLDLPALACAHALRARRAPTCGRTDGRTHEQTAQHRQQDGSPGNLAEAEGAAYLAQKGSVTMRDRQSVAAQRKTTDSGARKRIPGKVLWKYRSELAPLYSGIGMVAMSAHLHSNGSGGWEWGMLPAAIGGGRAFKEKSWKWRTYYAASGLASAGWTSYTAANGISQTSLEVLAVGLPAIAAAHYGNSRLRVVNRIARRLQGKGWEKVSENVGLPGSRVLWRRRTKQGYRVMLKLVHGQTVYKVQGVVREIESALSSGHDSVRVERVKKRADRCILNVAVGGHKRVPLAWPGKVSATLPETVSIGRQDLGGEVVVPLRTHWIVAGKSGAGKSSVVRPIQATVCAAVNATMDLIDCKQGVEGVLWEKGTRYSAYTAEDAGTLISEVLRPEMNARLIEMRSKKQDKHVATESQPERFIIIDEGADLIRNLSAAQIKDLTAIAEQGRAAGFRLIWCTQYPLAEVLPTLISANAGVIVGLMTSKPQHANVIFGDGSTKEGWELHKLDGPGCFMVRASGYSEPVPCQAWWIEGGSIESLAEAGMPREGVYVPSQRAVTVPPVPEYAPTVGDAESATQSFGRLTLVKGSGPAGSVRQVPEDENEKALAALKRALAAAPAEGLHVSDLEQATGRKKTWLYPALSKIGAEKASKGYYRLPDQGDTEAV